MKKSGNALLTIVLFLVGIIAVFAADILIVNSFTTKNLAAGFSGDTSDSGIIDERGVFDEEPSTINGLQKRVRQCAEKTEMNILIYIAGDAHYGYSDGEIEDFDDRLYDQTFGEYTDGLIYYIDLSGQSPAHDDISRSGRAAMVYSEDDCQSIFSALDNYLPKSGMSYGSGDIRDAIEVFCEKLERFHDEYKPSNYKFFHDKVSNPSVYVFVKDGETYVTKGRAPGAKLIRLLIAELIGFVTGLVTYLIAKRRYKFKNTTNPSVYVSRERSALTERSDTPIRSYVTKHRISSNSGGGRGFGGGGGGHGGSHSHSGHSR